MSVKPFLSLDLRFGYRAHPVYTFGECETYHTFTGLRKLRMKLVARRFFVAWSHSEPYSIEPALAMVPLLLLLVLGAQADPPHTGALLGELRRS